MWCWSRSKRVWVYGGKTTMYLECACQEWTSLHLPQQVFRLRGRYRWYLPVEPKVPLFVFLYLMSRVLIITAIRSLGLHHTEAACLCDSSLRNYHPNHLKPGTARSGPVFNFTFDSSPPFFPLCHLSTPPIQPSHTVTAEFHSRANLYLQDNHSFPILQSGWLNGNWRFNFGNETWESFWNRLSPCRPWSWLVPILLSHRPPARHLLSPPWLADYCSQFLCLYGDMGKMDSANYLKCRRLLPDTFSLCLLFHDCTVVKQANT